MSAPREKARIGDTVRATWRALCAPVVVTGIVVGWSWWYGRPVLHVRLASPLPFNAESGEGGSNIRSEVDIEDLSTVTVVTRGPEWTDGDLADVYRGRPCDGAVLTDAGFARLGIAREVQS